MVQGRYYRLDDNGNVIPCRDVIEWGRWFGTTSRTIAYDQIPGVGGVSTVFLGLDHGFSQSPEVAPILWETMAFLIDGTDRQQRYATREEALEGHAAMVAELKGK